MPRTLENVTIHSTNINDFVVELAVTQDGHFAARAGHTPTDAHDAIFAWLQTLPDVVATPVVESPVASPVAPAAPATEPDAS